MHRSLDFRVPRPIRELTLDLLALIWPAQCLGCGRADREFCANCRRDLRVACRIPRWRVTPEGLDVWAAGAYNGALRRSLLSLKHDGRTGFARDLGALLRVPLLRALAEHSGPEPPMLVAIPSRAARVRERGYRHVDLLVRRALVGVPEAPLPGAEPGPRSCARLIGGALAASRGRVAQAGLPAEERKRNAARLRVTRRGARRLAGRTVILVDDVLTTGATLDAAARALRASGIPVLAGAVICEVPRRRGSEREPLLPDRSSAAQPPPVEGGGSSAERSMVNERRDGALTRPPA